MKSVAHSLIAGLAVVGTPAVSRTYHSWRNVEIGDAAERVISSQGLPDARILMHSIIGVFNYRIFTCGISHKEMVAAASGAFHIDVILIEHIQGFLDGGCPVQEHPHRDRGGNRSLVAFLFRRGLVQGKDAD